MSETQRYLYQKDKFTPQSPVETLQKLLVNRKVNKILCNIGHDLELEFICFLRRYNNLRSAWNLFIGNIIAVEDIYE